MAILYLIYPTYLEELKRLDDAGEIDLYYSDESGFCLIPPVPYEWQPVGKTIGVAQMKDESREDRN